MRNPKVTKYVLFLVFLGIILFFVRRAHYMTFLGSFLDGLWEMVFVIIIFDLKDKYIYTLLPLLLGVSIEVFQYICDKIGIHTITYYPGYADINDVIAYVIGYIVGIIFIYIFYTRAKKLICNK